MFNSFLIYLPNQSNKFSKKLYSQQKRRSLISYIRFFQLLPIMIFSFLYFFKGIGLLFSFQISPFKTLSDKKYNILPDFAVSLSYFYNFTNLTIFPPKIYYEETTKSTFDPPTYDTHPWISHSVFLILKDAYVNYEGRIVFNDFSKFSRNVYRKFPPLNITREIETAIYFGNEHIHMFAHIFLDVFAPLNLIPQSFIDSFPLLVSNSFNAHIQLYEILGLNVNNLIEMPKDRTYFYVHNLITVQNEWPENSHPGFPYFYLSTKLHKALNLDIIKPNRYILQNREKKNWRFITNFADLVEQVKKEMPQYNCEVYSKTNLNITEAAKMWNSCLIMYGPPGSNNANVIFMQKNSCMCIQLCVDIFDKWAIKQVQSMGVICVISKVTKGYHYNGPSVANINAAVNSLKLGLSLIKKYEEKTENITQNFEKGLKMHQCTNLTRKICTLEKTDY